MIPSCLHHRIYCLLLRSLTMQHLSSKDFTTHPYNRFINWPWTSSQVRSHIISPVPFSFLYPKKKKKNEFSLQSFGFKSLLQTLDVFPSCPSMESIMSMLAPTNHSSSSRFPKGPGVRCSTRSVTVNEKSQSKGFVLCQKEVKIQKTSTHPRSKIACS